MEGSEGPEGWGGGQVHALRSTCGGVPDLGSLADRETLNDMKEAKKSRKEESL